MAVLNSKPKHTRIYYAIDKANDGFTGYFLYTNVSTSLNPISIGPTSDTYDEARLEFDKYLEDNKMSINDVKLFGTYEDLSIAIREDRMKDDLYSTYPILKQNAGYFILDEDRQLAFGFSPTAPDKLVMWERSDDGFYISGKYSNSFSTDTYKEISKHVDVEKIQSILSNVGYTDFVKEIKQEFYGKIDFLYTGGVGQTIYYNNKDKYNKQINESNDIGRPIDASQIPKAEYEYEMMTSFQSLTIEGNTNTWSAVDKNQVGNKTYYLMENDEFGDETKYLIVNENKAVVVDEVYDGFEEDSFVEYVEKQKYKDTITAQLDELLEMNYITNDDYIYLNSDIDKINVEMQNYLSENSDVDMGTELDHLSNIIFTTLRKNTTSQSFAPTYIQDKEEDAPMVSNKAEQQDDIATTAQKLEPNFKKGSRMFIKNKTPKENFTQEQLARAKDVDLLNYVQTHGYTVKPHGSCYKLIENGHDSTVIFPSTNSWSNMASGIGGDTVAFLVKHENKNMVDAVKELIGETFDPQKLFKKQAADIRQNKERVILPERANNDRRVYAYLIKTRGIDRDIVDECIKNGSIYQSQEIIKKGDKEYNFSNCIFVGLDGEKTPRYASQRSMNDNINLSFKPFKQDVKNSEKDFGFLIKGNDNADWLTICEAPIDVLSVATLNKLKYIDSSEEHILSLGGVSDKAIDEFLKHNDKIKVINVCLDNDEPGRSAGDKIREKYSELGYKVVESYPKAKDYNLELQRELARKNQPVIDAPEQAPNNKRAFMHLTQTKQLDKDIVTNLLNDGSIYQADKQITDSQGNPKTISNTIFVQKDETGTPVYAISVNYNMSQDRADFKVEYKNEEQARSYLSQKGDSNDLLVFNNPISMLSHQTYVKDKGDINHNNYICCISNPVEAINQYIQDNPDIKDVKVMLDMAVSFNEKTRQQVDFREFTYKKIKKAIASRKVSVSKKFAKGIDLNRDLQAVKNAEKISTNKKSNENCEEKEI